MGDRKKDRPENTFQIAPSYKQKFPVAHVKELISGVLEGKLRDKQYQADHSSTWTKEIADEVKNKLKELGLPRYKFMVQVVLGEQRGQGVRMGSRSFWDTNTDNSASHTYTNDNLFCVCVAFGVYLY